MKKRVIPVKIASKQLQASVTTEVFSSKIIAQKTSNYIFLLKKPKSHIIKELK